VQWQLIFFRSGARKNEVMQAIVEQLCNEDIGNLGAYFASLPRPRRQSLMKRRRWRRGRKSRLDAAVHHARPIHLQERRGQPASQVNTS
jgi:cytochrome c553